MSMSREASNRVITSDGSDVQISAIPLFTRRYYHSAAQAYNMARYLVEELKLDKVVFATAMSYWHEFATQFGERHINVIVLVAAAVFLAGKVEHYKMRVDDILRLAFEIHVKQESSKSNATRTRAVEHSNINEAVSNAESNIIGRMNDATTTTNNTSTNRNNEPELVVKTSNAAGTKEMYKFASSLPIPDEDHDVEAWRTMLLRAELVLCDALHFDFQRTHPTREIQEILDAYFSMSTCTCAKTEHKNEGKGNIAKQVNECDKRQNISSDNNNIYSSSNTNSEMQKKLESVATRLYVLSLITPLYTRLNASAVIRTIVHMTLVYAGCETEEEDVRNKNNSVGNANDTNNVWSRFPLPMEEVRRTIVHMLFDALDFMGKKTGLQLLDEQISGHRKQERTASPLGFASSVSFNSSSSPPLPLASNNDNTS